jgi:metallo-beta-lactamase class B
MSARAGGLAAVLLISSAAVSLLASAADPQEGNRPADPFRIADNLYYVGSSDIGSYLITTAAGHILIDAGYVSTVPMIESSVATLGFKVEDIRILLNTQGHGDHAGGFAALKERTGAKLMVSAADADLIERGGARDFSLGDTFTFPAARVDRRLRDGDTVTLGNMTLTAHLTPGHTKGCTTWTFDVHDQGRTLHVVDLCGLAILENTRVSGMPGYPGIAKDYERTFATLKQLPIDLFIGAHASYYGGMEKAATAKANPAGPNPFVDPQGFRRVVVAAERRFREQLARERNARGR